MDKKALSLPILISLVIGNMIGTGIYILPASLANFGPVSLLAWIYTSVGALFLALTFTHLTKRFPKTGGPYVYCKEAYGPLAGFVVAYTYWLSNLVSIAALAVAGVGYLGFLIPLFNSNSPTYSALASVTLEIGIVWLFTGINLVGIHAAGVVQLFITVIKISPLLLISFFGIRYIHPENFIHLATNHESTFSVISSAAAITFWAFLGLESATVPAENTQGYRDIYKATVYGTLVTSIIYIISCIILMGVLSTNELQHSQFPFAQAATHLFGSTGGWILTFCAVISGLGSLNVCVLLQGQIVFAAARDHLFPKRFAKLSKHDVPIAGQLLSSGIVTLFLIFTVSPSLLQQFNHIALLAAMLTLTTYFASALAELKFVLLERQSTFQLLASKTFLIPFFAAAYSLWMISSFSQVFLLAGMIVFAIAAPIYLLFIRKQLHLAHEMG